MLMDIIKCAEAKYSNFLLVVLNQDDPKAWPDIVQAKNVPTALAVQIIDMDW